MCLAVPVKVVSIKGSEAEVDAGGVKRLVSIIMTPEVKIGQYVLLHTGYSISVIDEAEAQETLRLLHDMLKFDEIR